MHHGEDFVKVGTGDLDFPDHAPLSSYYLGGHVESKESNLAQQGA